MPDKFIFDGPALRVRARLDQTVNGMFQFSTYELYAEWKRWVQQGDNAKYPPVFRTVGGDPIGAGQYVGFYLFMRNDLGWMGVPPDTSPVAVMIEGSFFGESPNLPVMEMIEGNTTSLIINRSSLTQAIAIDGGSDPQAVAQAILAAAQATPIHADMRKTNNEPIVGDGTEGNKFRSHLVP